MGGLDSRHRARSHAAMFHSLQARCLSLLCAFAMPTTASFAASQLVYVGTYTGPKSKGIHAFRTDPASGVIEELGLVAETQNPTFLALHPDGRHLYAANEVGTFEGKPGGAVTGYRIDPANGSLTAINSASTIGGGPCHLVVDRTGRQVLVANYGGGSVASLPLDPSGRLSGKPTFHQHAGSSVNPNRQKEPHGHSINLSPDNRFAFAADLGTDRLYVYPFSPDRGLWSPALPTSPRLDPGSGPRHFAFHPSGRFAYVINELLSTITVFRYAATSGRLEAIQTVPTLPAGFTGSSTTAEVVVHPNGRFLYGSNRGHDSLAVFSIHPDDGRLSLIGHEPTGGKTPRNFNIEPGGRTLWAANQGSDNIVVFNIDTQSGRLTRTGQELRVGSPVCIKFLPLP